MLQGPIIGSLLFVVCIDELADLLKLFGLFFADDSKIAKIITEDVDCLALERDLEIVSDWCECNRMPITKEKSNVLPINV